MSRDGSVALPHGATGLSAVCDCGISGSYSFTIFISLRYIHNTINNLVFVPLFAVSLMIVDIFCIHSRMLPSLKCYR